MHEPFIADQALVDGHLEVKAGPLRATLLIHGAVLRGSTPPTRDDVARKLKEAKILHGVDWALVDRIVAEKLYDRTHVVAGATLPTEGRNAWIEQKIRVELDAKPKVLEDGKADYKNVDNIRQVQKGQLLAVKHPAVEGRPGVDIFGRAIPPEPVKDVELRLGANTQLSDDGTRLLAAVAGFLQASNGTISVGDEYYVRGDVGFDTGNIRYQGSVRVKGNVTGGFKVEAEGDILVEGIAECAELISLKGSVRVLQGVFGQGKGCVRAHGDIHLAFAQDVLLECQGTLVVEKGLRNCRAVAGVIKADHKRCSLVGGSLKAYREVFAYAAGAEGCRTDILIVDKAEEEARLKLPQVEVKKRQAETQIVDLDKKMKELAALSARSGGKLPKEAQDLMNRILAGYGAAKKALGPLEEERRKLREALNCFPNRIGRAVFRERISSGVRLNLYGLAREMLPEDARKEWRWNPDSLISLTATDE